MEGMREGRVEVGGGKNSNSEEGSGGVRGEGRGSE